MSFEDINLYHLFISVPIEFLMGEPTLFKQKSIGAILDDQDLFELSTLQEWISSQVLMHIDWDITKEITKESIEKAFHLFDEQGIRPTKCMFIEEGDLNDFNEPPSSSTSNN